ncbi:MAG: ATP-binding cassette domain-containing protein [Chloroflexota bacterium]
MPLLTVEHLKKEYPVQPRSFFRRSSDVVRPIADVSFDVNAGEIVAIAGDAASGKTILARLLTLLIRPNKGNVIFDDQNLTKMSDGALRPVRRRLQLLFSDPRTALNPRSLVSDMMLEPMQIQNIGSADEQMTTVKNALRRVGLNALLLDHKMTDLSAGERQRIALARVLTLHPKLIICDDPSRAMPSGAAESFFRLMSDLRRRDGVSFIFLVREIQPAAQFADRLGILYRGHLVEMGKMDSVIGSPQHPYARQWFSKGSVPSATTDVSLKGCQFHPDCPNVMPRCKEKIPILFPTLTSQSAACFLYEKINSGLTHLNHE